MGNDIDDIDKHCVDHLPDDEHLYSRRASHHTLYSVTTSTSSSAAPSPTSFSRRGSSSLGHHGYGRGDDAPALTLPPPSTSLYATAASREWVNPYTRLSTANYDGVIRNPAAHPYARSHLHHHPYARTSTRHRQIYDLSDDNPAAGTRNNDGDDVFAVPGDQHHPYYSSRKRHSFAALRTTTSSSAAGHVNQQIQHQQHMPIHNYQQNHDQHSNMIPSSNNAGPSSSSGGLRAPNSPPIPLVRLPSIDQGLPPFSADGSMILPIRRGSLTDPMLHVHNSSASSSGMYATSAGGGSGLAGTSFYGSGFNGHSLAPGSALRNPYPATHYYPAYDHEQRLPPRTAEQHPNTSNYTFSSQQHPPPRSAPHLQPTPPVQPPVSREGLPLFGKTSKTLFPAQHGAGTEPASPTSDSQVQQSSGQLPAAPLLGTKRKHEPSPSDTTQLQQSRTIGATSDYFTHDVPPTGRPAAPLPASNKRRPSQSYSGPLPIIGNNGLPLPTPPMTVSATSGGEDNSAASSERRSSNGTNGEEGGGKEIAASIGAAPQQQSEVAAQSDQHRPNPGRIVSRQVSHYSEDGLRTAHMLDAVDADSKPNYAFPMQRPSSGASAGSGAGGPSPQVSRNTYQQSEYNVNAPPPIAEDAQYRQGGSAYADGGYAPTSQQSPLDDKRLPVATTGPYYQSSLNQVNLPADLRDRANAIFGTVRQGWPAAPGASANRLDALRMGAGSEDTKDGSSPYARSPALKVSHKIAERKRRKEMKELFDELRDSIPSMALSSGGGGTGSAGSTPAADTGGRGIKSSKWEVLAKAIEYIGKIQYESQELVNTVLDLQSRNQALQEELAQLRSTAGDSNPAGHPMSVQAGSALDYQRENSSPSGPFGTIPVRNFPPSSGGPAPLPGTVHAPPPHLPHSSHSMPPPTNLGPPHLQPAHSSLRLQSPAHQSPYDQPISAPPHMQNHPFFTSNDVINDSGDRSSTSPQYSHAPHPNQQHSQAAVQQPQQPPPHHYVQQLQQSSPRQKHERTTSDPSGSGTYLLASGGPVSPSHRQALGAGTLSHSPVPVNQGVPIFGGQKQQQPLQYQPGEPQSYQHVQQGNYGPRPVSHHSHNSAQSIPSMHSQSPQPPPPQQIQMQIAPSQGRPGEWLSHMQAQHELGASTSPQHAQAMSYPASGTY